MPRKAVEFEVLEKPKRAPRKRAVKAVDESIEEKPKRPRKVAVKKEQPEEAVVRKAPTPLAAERQQKVFVRKHAIVIAVLLLLGIGSSAAIGLTDPGRIDVMTIVDERNKIASERGEKPVTLAEEAVVNGGLTLADPNSQQQATSTPQTTASSTASSTPQDASSDTEAAAVQGTAAASASSTQP